MEEAEKDRERTRKQKEKEEEEERVRLEKEKEDRRRIQEAKEEQEKQQKLEEETRKKQQKEKEEQERKEKLEKEVPEQAILLKRIESEEDKELERIRVENDEKLKERELKFQEKTPTHKFRAEKSITQEISFSGREDSKQENEESERDGWEDEEDESRAKERMEGVAEEDGQEEDETRFDDDEDDDDEKEEKEEPDEDERPKRRLTEVLVEDLRVFNLSPAQFTKMSTTYHFKNKQDRTPGLSEEPVPLSNKPSMGMHWMYRYIRTEKELYYGSRRRDEDLTSEDRRREAMSILYLKQREQLPAKRNAFDYSDGKRAEWLESLSEVKLTVGKEREEGGALPSRHREKAPKRAAQTSGSGESLPLKLQEVLAFPVYRNILHKWMQGQLCAENLDFYVEVTNFTNLCRQPFQDQVARLRALVRRASEIVDEYVKEGGPQQVNLEGKTRKITISKLEKFRTLLSQHQNPRASRNQNNVASPTSTSSASSPFRDSNSITPSSSGDRTSWRTRVSGLKTPRIQATGNELIPSTSFNNNLSQPSSPISPHSSSALSNDDDPNDPPSAFLDITGNLVVKRKKSDAETLVPEPVPELPKPSEDDQSKATPSSPLKMNIRSLQGALMKNPNFLAPRTTLGFTPPQPPPQSTGIVASDEAKESVEITHFTRAKVAKGGKGKGRRPPTKKAFNPNPTSSPRASPSSTITPSTSSNNLSVNIPSSRDRTASAETRPESPTSMEDPARPDLIFSSSPSHSQLSQVDENKSIDFPLLKTEFGEEEKEEKLSKKKLEEAELVGLSDIFAISTQEVLTMVERDAFFRFTHTDDYLWMVCSKFAKQLKSGIPLTEWAWVNTDQYKFIGFGVLEGRQLPSASNPYLEIVIDSKHHKTTSGKGATPVWTDENVEIPISSTTQFIEIIVWDKNALSADRFLGHVLVPLQQIQYPFKPRWYKLIPRSEGLSDTESPEEKDKPVGEPEESESQSDKSITEADRDVNKNNDNDKSDSEESRKKENERENSKREASKIRKENDEDELGFIQLSITLLKEESLDGKQKATAVQGPAGLKTFVRQKISKKKRRFQEDGFDLDLTYITERVVSMGFPSEGTESIYRNPLSEVKRFFDLRHINCYKLYNLCSERAYDAAKFYGRVARYPFDDHNPCPFEMIDKFCEDVDDWLHAFPQNVAVVHCKAGKGRTGMLISCYLVYSNQCADAKSALEFFGAKRTHNNKGVTIPSQNRYVRYYERYLRAKRNKSGRFESAPTLYVRRIRLTGLPRQTNAKDLMIAIFCKEDKFKSRIKGVKTRIQDDVTEWEVDGAQYPVTDDFRVELINARHLSKKKIVKAWLNTRFVTAPVPKVPTMRAVELTKPELDGPHKDTKHKKFPVTFKLEIFLDESPTPSHVKATSNPVVLTEMVTITEMPFPETPSSVLSSKFFVNPIPYNLENNLGSPTSSIKSPFSPTNSEGSRLGSSDDGMEPLLDNSGSRLDVSGSVSRSRASSDLAGYNPRRSIISSTSMELIPASTNSGPSAPTTTVGTSVGPGVGGVMIFPSNFVHPSDGTNSNNSSKTSTPPRTKTHSPEPSSSATTPTSSIGSSFRTRWSKRNNPKKNTGPKTPTDSSTTSTGPTIISSPLSPSGMSPVSSTPLSPTTSQPTSPGPLTTNTSPSNSVSISPSVISPTAANRAKIVAAMSQAQKVSATPVAATPAKRDQVLKFLSHAKTQPEKSKGDSSPFSFLKRNTQEKPKDKDKEKDKEKKEKEKKEKEKEKKEKEKEKKEKEKEKPRMTANVKTSTLPKKTSPNTSPSTSLVTLQSSGRTSPIPNFTPPQSQQTAKKPIRKSTSMHSMSQLNSSAPKSYPARSMSPMPSSKPSPFSSSSSSSSSSPSSSSSSSSSSGNSGKRSNPSSRPYTPSPSSTPPSGTTPVGSRSTSPVPTVTVPILSPSGNNKGKTFTGIQVLPDPTKRIKK